jgi:hypothetical protein
MNDAYLHVPFSAFSTTLPKYARQSFTKKQQSRVSAHNAVPPIVLPEEKEAKRKIPMRNAAVGRNITLQPS